MFFLETLKSSSPTDSFMIIVKAKIKDLAGDLSVASDLPDALNQKVEQLIKDAVVRAQANGRRTVMAKDL